MFLVPFQTQVNTMNLAKSTLLAALLLPAISSSASAALVTVDAATFGIFEKSVSGASTSISHTTPDNLPRYDLGSPFSSADTQITIRHYFVYDLSQVTGKIVGATLKIFSPSDARSPNETDHYKISAVSTGIDVLTNGNSSTAENLAGFDDMNDGTLYGQAELKASTITTGSVLTIELAGALADLNAKLGGKFALGGAIDPIVSQDDGNGNLLVPYYFSGAQGSTDPAPQLILETAPVPLPAAWTLFLAGAAGLSFAKKRRLAA